MRRIVVILTLLLFCGTDDCNEANRSKQASAPPTSMRVIEYSEITGTVPGPTVHVWMVADDKRDLCFVVFNSGGSSVAPVRIDCAVVNSKTERGYP